MSEFEFEPIHRAGTSHNNADALSGLKPSKKSGRGSKRKDDKSKNSSKDAKLADSKSRDADPSTTKNYTSAPKSKKFNQFRKKAGSSHIVM